jgi:hypothetical protein
MRVTLPTTDGPFDLTGWTVAIFEPSAQLGSNISVSVDNAAAGRVIVRIEWANSYPVGVVHEFRIKVSKDGEDVGFPQIQLEYV